MSCDPMGMKTDVVEDVKEVCCTTAAAATCSAALNDICLQRV